jgi:Domain of unknown function (DUF4386)
MDRPSPQTLARLAGALFVITFLTSIPAVLLYDSILNDTDFIVGGAGANGPVLLGAVLELLLIVANLGTALALFPVVKRQNEGVALGYVTARVMECAFIGVGIVSLLAITTLRDDGGNARTLEAIGQSLVAIHDWTFVLGPGFVVGIGNGLLLGYLMYRSGLVPRGMAMLGLVGGPLIVVSGALVVLGVFERGGLGQGIATIPEFLWEASLGIYLLVKGFRAGSPVLAA